MLVLDAETIGKLISMKEAIREVAKAYVLASAGKGVFPLRTSIEVDNGIILFMPGYLEGSSVVGVKVASVFRDNPNVGLPTIFSVIMINDLHTGMPLALLDGSIITAIRTGASSGVATAHLSNPSSHVLSIFGAGTQAKTQLEAVLETRPISEIKVFDTYNNRSKSFIEKVQELVQRFGATIREAQNAKEAVEGADIIVTATTSKEPVFDGSLVKKGAHINAIGAFTPEMRELDLSVIKRAGVVFVDSREAVSKEAGDLIYAKNAGVIKQWEDCIEIGEFISQTKTHPCDEKDITIFKSVGISALDMALASFIYHKAKQINAGTEIKLFSGID